MTGLDCKDDYSDCVLLLLKCKLLFGYLKLTSGNCTCWELQNINSHIGHQKSLVQTFSWTSVVFKTEDYWFESCNRKENLKKRYKNDSSLNSYWHTALEQALNLPAQGSGCTTQLPSGTVYNFVNVKQKQETWTVSAGVS